MTYEMNKCYKLTGKDRPILDFFKGNRVWITKIQTDIHETFYWVTKSTGDPYIFTASDIETLGLVSEDISFTMHVLKYAPQDMDEFVYRNYLSCKLNEEVNELREILSEGLHNHDNMNSKHLVEEIGDIFYFFTAICEAYGITLDEIKEANIKKLQKRFQKGYWNQEEADLKRDHSKDIFTKGCEQLQKNINKANNEGTIKYVDGDSVTVKIKPYTSLNDDPDVVARRELLEDEDNE